MAEFLGLDEVGWLKLLWTTNSIFIVYILGTYWLAGNLIRVWCKAWWSRKPISLEWTKDRSWIFQIPKIDKGIPEIWELDDGKRAIQVRREAIGIAPHKVPMMVSTAEFPAGISPTEVHGERYFIPSKWFYGIIFNDHVIKVDEPTEEEKGRYMLLEEKRKDITILANNPEFLVQTEQEYQALSSKMLAWESRQMYVEYPEHGLDLSEFTKYQSVSTDPKLMAQYARRKEMQAKIDSANPINYIWQNAHVLIPYY